MGGVRIIVEFHAHLYFIGNSFSSKHFEYFSKGGWDVPLTNISLF